MMQDRLAPLYRALMDAQRNGVCTETNLLDCAQHFWYNGSIGEYYGSAYVRKGARGA
jgi:hypothetical protein